ncbi:hypothetical protein GCM10018785_07930 [Streptomyces longispororuber]|uniref:Uncharacterized protein n=1 Tax=Streptomyces longispororuber TaxID=68230 RepID=A0A918Z7P5_9ACTN|nr:hypothetical protein GCM10018785_07930 [Streptomyces longispororuber]
MVPPGSVGRAGLAVSLSVRETDDLIRPHGVIRVLMIAVGLQGEACVTHARAATPV